MGFVEALKGQMAGNILNILVYAAIVFVFIMGLVKCIVPVMRTRGLLRRAIRNIRAGSGARRSWQEDDFLGNGVLSNHWSEYLNNLFFADGAYHNASNVEDYINEETVIHGPGRASFCDAVPTLLVSIGFLGTLIGLSQGLSGFSMNDSAETMNSIKTLIPGMRYAFMTSIFGVIGSVAFTLITRGVQGSTQHTLRDFYGAMSRHAGVLSVDPMTQVAIYQQEQTALIRKMSVDLNNALTSGLGDAVKQAVEPLNQTMRNYVTVSSKEQMRFLDSVVSRFISRMDEMLGGQFQRLGRTMDMVNTSIEDNAHMVSGMREIAQISEDMVRNNAAYIKELRNHQADISDAINRVSGNVEQMDLISRQQSGYLKTVSAMQAEVSRSMEQMTAAVDNYTRRMAGEGTDMANGVLRATAELRAVGEELSVIHKDCVAAINHELKITLDSYQDYVNQFTQRVDYLASGISQSLEAMPNAVNATANELLDQVDRMNKTLAQAQRALSDAAARLYGDPRARH
ncbi:MAG: methyl-accepting chemotaxis protein [Clostridia bacterium]|nr:methyl-accepting chemotaxis protein [Clostridia bacterium]